MVISKKLRSVIKNQVGHSDSTKFFLRDNNHCIFCDFSLILWITPIYLYKCLFTWQYLWQHFPLIFTSITLRKMMEDNKQMLVLPSTLLQRSMTIIYRFSCILDLKKNLLSIYRYCESLQTNVDHSLYLWSTIYGKILNN